MDNREEAKIGMFRSVRDLLSGASVATILQAAPLIASARQDLADIIGSLEQFDIERALAASGDGDNKKGLKALALSSALTVDGMITAHAATKKDATLLQAFNHEKSDYAGSDQKFQTMCGATLAKGRELLAANVTGIAATGLTETALTILETRLAAFVAAITKPEDLAKHESTMVKMIDAQFALAEQTLDLVLDKLMRQFAETQPQLYTSYQNARKINDPGTRQEKKPAAGTPPPTP